MSPSDSCRDLVERVAEVERKAREVLREQQQLRTGLLHCAQERDHANGIVAQQEVLIEQLRQEASSHRRRVRQLLLREKARQRSAEREAAAASA